MEINIDTKTLSFEEAMGLTELLIQIHPHIVGVIIGLRNDTQTIDSMNVKINVDTKEAVVKLHDEIAKNTLNETSQGNKSDAFLTGLGGVELDSNGLPWDGRIHSEGRAKLTDGGWRKRRGVAPELFAQVEAELRALMAVPQSAPVVTPEQAFGAQVTAATGIVPQVAVQPTYTPAPVPLPPAPVADPLAIPAFLNRSLQVAAPAPPAPPAPAPVAAGATPQDIYIALVGRASAAVQVGKLTQEEIVTACTKFGVPALPLVVNRPDLLGVIANEIDAIIASRA